MSIAGEHWVSVSFKPCARILYKTTHHITFYSFNHSKLTTNIMIKYGIICQMAQRSI